MTQADVLSGKKPVRRRREEENNQGRLGAQGKVSLQDGSGQGPGGWEGFEYVCIFRGGSQQRR